MKVLKSVIASSRVINAVFVLGDSSEKQGKQNLVIRSSIPPVIFVLQML